VQRDSSGVRLISTDSATTLAEHAASIVLSWIIDHPGSSVVFPTGATPRLLYQHLREKPDPKWQSIRLFHLDEYVPPEETGKSFKYQTFKDEIKQLLWDHIPGEPHFFGPSTVAPERYEAELTRNHTERPGLIILGIGGNGHVAFNEPPCGPDAPTRQIELSAQTIQSNFGVEPGTPGYPTQAATLGLSLILSAQQILLLATGERKRAIVRQAFDPTMKPEESCPASWLKRHSNVTVLTDFSVF
jgi:glucosamine-6-phosphate deaminase